MFIAGTTLVVLSLIFLITISFFVGTIHPKRGGEFKEGLIGTNILKLNPVLATNENEDAILRLLYRGLFKINERGEIVPDLAETYEVQNNGSVWVITLKEGIKWQDGTPITSNDVVFTVDLIHNLENDTPLQNSWQGVAVEKISEKKVKFSIPNPYAFFLTNLKLQIIPKHIFETVPTKNLPISPYNIKPVGSGPYKVESVSTERDGRLKSYRLKLSRETTKETAYIEYVSFLFYDTKTEALRALNLRQIDALANIEPQQISSLSSSYKIVQMKRPLYYAAFLNPQNNAALKELAVRKSLLLGTPQSHLIEKVLLGHASPLNSPIPPPIRPGEETTYDVEKAKSLLLEAGWEDVDGDGIREKKKNKNENLSLTIITPQNSFLIETASILAKSWKELGIDTTVEIVPLRELELNYIEPRKYDVLLFGNVLDLEADPFSFWHSSQKFNPGRNLSLYQNKTVDRLTETIRETLDGTKRNDLYLKFEEEIKEDVPVIFLYSPDFLYAVSKRIKNIPSQIITLPGERFSTIEQWFIKSYRSL